MIATRGARTRNGGESTASLQTLERRTVALEARLAEVEGGYGATLYRLHRSSVTNDLRMAKVLGHLGIEDITDAASRQRPQQPGHLAAFRGTHSADDLGLG